MTPEIVGRLDELIEEAKNTVTYHDCAHEHLVEVGEIVDAKTMAGMNPPQKLYRCAHCDKKLMMDLKSGSLRHPCSVLEHDEDKHGGS